MQRRTPVVAEEAEEEKVRKEDEEEEEREQAAELEVVAGGGEPRKGGTFGIQFEMCSSLICSGRCHRVVRGFVLVCVCVHVCHSPSLSLFLLLSQRACVCARVPVLRCVCVRLDLYCSRNRRGRRGEGWGGVTGQTTQKQEGGGIYISGGCSCLCCPHTHTSSYGCCVAPPPLATSRLPVCGPLLRDREGGGARSSTDVHPSSLAVDSSPGSRLV